MSQSAELFKKLLKHFEIARNIFTDEIPDRKFNGDGVINCIIDAHINSMFNILQLLAEAHPEYKKNIDDLSDSIIGSLMKNPSIKSVSYDRSKENPDESNP